MDRSPNPSHLLFTTIGYVPMPSVLARFRLGTTSSINAHIDVDNHFSRMVSTLGIKLCKQHDDVYRSRNPVYLVPDNVLH